MTSPNHMVVWIAVLYFSIQSPHLFRHLYEMLFAMHISSCCNTYLLFCVSSWLQTGHNKTHSPASQRATWRGFCSGLQGGPHIDLAPDGVWENDSPHCQEEGCSTSQYTSATTVVVSGDSKTFPENRESWLRLEDRTWCRWGCERR